MHARNRTWALGSDPAERCRQRTMPVEGGDGSTLSLDFTTGVLDPRLTFTRLSDATFINSSGLVEYADANWVRNSTMLVSTLWTATTVNGGTATINGDGSVTFASTAGRITWLQTLGLASGLPITFSIEVTALTAGDIRVSDLFAAGFGFGSQIYHYTSPSGVTQNNISSTAGLGTFGVGLYTVTATTTGTTNNIIFGTDCNGINRTGSVTIRNPQVQYGTVVPRRVYVPNSSTSSAKWDSARFDYDPTTIGSPRGLLIEGSATNICTYSGDLTQSGAGHWSVRTALITTSWTGFTAPDGTATAVKIIPDTTSSRHTIESSSTTVVSGTTYTASAFVKASGYTVASLVIAGGQTRRNFTLSGLGTVESQFGVTNTATITPVGTDGWYRITMTWTANATGGAGLWIGVPQNATTDVVSSWSGNGTSAIQAWGAQLETGSGASSYIPTGASTGSRVADVCTIGVDAGTATNFSSWWPLNQSQFTVAWTGDLVRNTSTAQFLWLTRNSGGTSLMRVFASSSSGQPLTGFAGNTIPTSVTVNGTPGATLKTALAAQEGDQAVYANNGTVSSSGVAANTGLLFTSVNMNFNPNGDQFMHIKSFKFWPLRLPNATLEALVS